jgi:peroxiredoxin
VNNGQIEKWFIEGDVVEDNYDSDPYGVTSPENILDWLRQNS